MVGNVKATERKLSKSEISSFKFANSAMNLDVSEVHLSIRINSITGHELMCLCILKSNSISDLASDGLKTKRALAGLEMKRINIIIVKRWSNS